MIRFACLVLLPLERLTLRLEIPADAAPDTEDAPRLLTAEAAGARAVALLADLDARAEIKAMTPPQGAGA